MMYVKEKNSVKEVNLTNKNIDKMMEKDLFWIQCLHDGAWLVNKWDNDKERWIGISTNYIRLGNAIRFIKKYCERV